MANSHIIHDLQNGALTVDGAEMLRKLDMMKFNEVLKRKFLEGPGSNQSSLEALNRSMVNLDQARGQNRKYEEDRLPIGNTLLHPLAFVGSGSSTFD